MDRIGNGLRGLGALAVIAAAGCSLGRPVGAVGHRVPSRFGGPPLALVVDSDAEVADAPAPAPAPALEQASYEAYVVQPGDTLWSIARRHGTTVDRLYALNGMTDPRSLRAGQALQVPHSEGREATSLKSPEAAPSTPEAEPEPEAAAAATPKPSGTSRYALSWPVEGTITSRFGRRGGRPHDGIDIGATRGTPVRAAAAGEVVFAGTHGGYGKLVLVRHPGGLVTVYAHQRDIAVRKGQRVASGQLLGHVGTTGRSTGPHLHFEVRRGASPQNPLRFLPP